MRRTIEGVCKRFASSLGVLLNCYKKITKQQVESERFLIYSLKMHRPDHGREPERQVSRRGPEPMTKRSRRDIPGLLPTGHHLKNDRPAPFWNNLPVSQTTDQSQEKSGLSFFVDHDK